MRRVMCQYFKANLPQASSAWIALYACGAIGLVDRLRRRSLASPFLIGWAVASVAAVALGGPFFGHYFLQAELPLALVAALPFASFTAARPRLAPLRW